MNLGLYKEDLEKQTKGVPVYIDDAVFEIRRWGTPESNAFRNNLQKSLFSPTHKMTEEDESFLFANWLVDYGIVGWYGVFENKPEEVINEAVWAEMFSKIKKMFRLSKEKSKAIELAKTVDGQIVYSKRAARAIFLNKAYYLSLNKILFLSACNYELFLHEEAEAHLENLKKL